MTEHICPYCGNTYNSVLYDAAEELKASFSSVEVRMDDIKVTVYSTFYSGDLKALDTVREKYNMRMFISRDSDNIYAILFRSGC